MGTPTETIIELFLRRIEKDSEFFEYFNVPDDEALELVHQRANNFLEESIYKLISRCNPKVDFLSRDDNGNFTFELNAQEKELLPSLMYESYLDRDFAYLKTLSSDYTTTELRVFDPSNARSTFLKIYNTVHDYNEKLLQDYKDTERETGEYKIVDFSKYDFE